MDFGSEGDAFYLNRVGSEGGYNEAFQRSFKATWRAFILYSDQYFPGSEEVKMQVFLLKLIALVLKALTIRQFCIN